MAIFGKVLAEKLHSHSSHLVVAMGILSVWTGIIFAIFTGSDPSSDMSKANIGTITASYFILAVCAGGAVVMLKRESAAEKTDIIRRAAVILMALPVAWGIIQIAVIAHKESGNTWYSFAVAGCALELILSGLTCIGLWHALKAHRSIPVKAQ